MIFKKLFKNKKNIMDENFCYSDIIWYSKDNLIILLSFTKEYFRDIIELQEAISYTDLKEKIIFSSYDEELEDETILSHERNYMLISGNTDEWAKLFTKIDISNKCLGILSKEISNNCYFESFDKLIEDSIIKKFKYNNSDNTPQYNNNMRSKSLNGNTVLFNDPKYILDKLPVSITGKDLFHIIKVSPYKDYWCSPYKILETYGAESVFKNESLMEVFNLLMNKPSLENLKLITRPLYFQPDDDTFPGSIDDDALDDIFKENYEKFSALIDDNNEYEDIDEILSEDEEEY